MRLIKFTHRPEDLVSPVECITFKDVLNSMENGSEVLDMDRNTNYQCQTKDDLKLAQENPMGLFFVSRLESGVDGHNPVFSNVAERLGLDQNFNPPVESGTADE